VIGDKRQLGVRPEAKASGGQFFSSCKSPCHKGLSPPDDFQQKPRAARNSLDGQPWRLYDSHTTTGSRIVQSKRVNRKSGGYVAWEPAAHGCAVHASKHAGLDHRSDRWPESGGVRMANCAKQSQFAMGPMSVNCRSERRLRRKGTDCGSVKTKPISRAEIASSAVGLLAMTYAGEERTIRPLLGWRRGPIRQNKANLPAWFKTG
jgi:hypothetical protein